MTRQTGPSGFAGLLMMVRGLSPAMNVAYLDEVAQSLTSVMTCQS